MSRLDPDAARALGVVDVRAVRDGPVPIHDADGAARARVRHSGDRARGPIAAVGEL